MRGCNKGGNASRRPLGYGHDAHAAIIAMAMSRPPTDLDAILESIRQRIADPSAVPPPPAPPPVTIGARAARIIDAPVVAAGNVSVEALVTAVLEPLLHQWLDANMPEIAERVAMAEIRRLTGQA